MTRLQQCRQQRTCFDIDSTTF